MASARAAERRRRGGAKCLSRRVCRGRAAGCTGSPAYGMIVNARAGGGPDATAVAAPELPRRAVASPALAHHVYALRRSRPADKSARAMSAGRSGAEPPLSLSRCRRRARLVDSAGFDPDPALLNRKEAGRRYGFRRARRSVIAYSRAARLRPSARSSPSGLRASARAAEGSGVCFQVIEFETSPN